MVSYLQCVLSFALYICHVYVTYCSQGLYVPTDVVGQQCVQTVCRLSASTFASRHPTAWSVQNIMSRCWNLRWLLYFCRMEGFDEDIVHVSGQDTFSKKGRFMKICIFFFFLQFWKYVDGGAGFRNFVRITAADFGLLLQMTSSFNAFLLLGILNTCFGGSKQ